MLAQCSMACRVTSKVRHDNWTANGCYRSQSEMMLSAPSIHGHEKSVTWFHYALRNNKGISCLTKVMMVVTPVLSVGPDRRRVREGAGVIPPGHTRSMGGGSLTDGILVVKRVTREREREKREDFRRYRIGGFS
jgi:hypothetical protein